MRQAGCVVSCNIAIAISKGIVLANDQTLFKGNGVSLNIDFLWCQSIFQRIGFTNRRATVAKEPVFPGFLDEMGFSFHTAIKEVVDAYDIPDDLMININPTPPPFILLNKCTMDKKNENLVPVTNSADFRQVTGTFSQLPIPVFFFSPIQIIYQRQTDHYHPIFQRVQYYTQCQPLV